MVDWIGIDKTSGSSGTTKITITASSYTELTARTTSLTVTGKQQPITGTVSITQQPEEVTTGLTVTPTELVFDSTGETLYITITSNAAWTWGVWPDWVGVQDAYLTGGKAGTTTVSIGAVKNSGTTELTGILSVKTYNETVEINCTQKAYTPPQIMESQTDSLDFTSGGGTNVFDVYSNGAWTVVSYPDWLTLSATGGTGASTPTGKEYVTVTCGDNTGDTRIGSIVLKASDENGATKTIYVTQEAKSDEPYVSVTPTSLAFSYNGDTESITITSNTNWGITYPSWVKLYSGNTLVTGQLFSGNAVFNVVVEENESFTDGKVGTILIESDTVTTGVTVTQPKFSGIKVTPNEITLASDETEAPIQIKSSTSWRVVNTGESELLESGEWRDDKCYILKCVIDEPVVSDIIAGVAINGQYFSATTQRFLFTAGTYYVKCKGNPSPLLDLYSDNLGIFAREISWGSGVTEALIENFPNLTSITPSFQTTSIRIHNCPNLKGYCGTSKSAITFEIDTQMDYIDLCNISTFSGVTPMILYSSFKEEDLVKENPSISYFRGTVAILSSTRVLDKDGGKGYCKILSPYGNWTASTDANWLVLDRTSGTPEDTEICYTVTAPNKKEYREATITFTTNIGSTELKIYQDYDGFASENTIYYISDSIKEITVDTDTVTINNAIFGSEDDVIAIKLPNRYFKISLSFPNLEQINTENCDIDTLTTKQKEIICKKLTKLNFSFFPKRIIADEVSTEMFNNYYTSSANFLSFPMYNYEIFAKKYFLENEKNFYKAIPLGKSAFKSYGFTTTLVPYKDYELEEVMLANSAKIAGIGGNKVYQTVEENINSSQLSGYTTDLYYPYGYYNYKYYYDKYNNYRIYTELCGINVLFDDDINGWNYIELYISDDVTTLPKEIPTSKYLYIGTGIDNIPSNSFNYSKNTEMVLMGVKNIEENAFLPYVDYSGVSHECYTTLLTLGYTGGVVTWSTNGVATDNIGLSAGIVYVPYELESAYKQDSNWKNYNIKGYKLTKNGVAICN